MKWLEKIILGTILPRWLIKASPAIRDILPRTIIELNNNAQITPNPYDNLVVGILAELFVVDLSDGKQQKDKKDDK